MEYVGRCGSKRWVGGAETGGRIVVSDFIMDDDRTSPEFGAIFALNMIVNTPGGDTYTASEVKSWMQAAGMSFFERNNGVMIGKKE